MESWLKKKFDDIFFAGKVLKNNDGNQEVGHPYHHIAGYIQSAVKI